MSLATGPSGQGDSLLKSLDREILQYKRTVQSNKQTLSGLRKKTKGKIKILNLQFWIISECACLLYIVYCILYIVHCILYIVHCILYIAYCIYLALNWDLLWCIFLGRDIDPYRIPEPSASRINARWTNEEHLLAVQGKIWGTNLGTIGGDE